MSVLFVTGEVAPFSKSGGLGDVSAALPKELVKQGLDIRVVSPFYATIPQAYKEAARDLCHFWVRIGWKDQYVGVKELVHEGVTHYFIDNQDYFNRPSIYGHWDDGERFGYFSIAVIEMMGKIGFIPQVIHVNDWHTAMIPALLVDKYHWVEAYKGIRKVLTIHNLRFQGIFDPIILQSVFNTTYATMTHDGALHTDGHMVNFLKAGINFSDLVTTVSPTYAKEIQTPEFGEGLDGVLRYNSWKLRGILNGIDYESNNPQTDPHIPFKFSLDQMEGKAADKAALQAELGLDQRPDQLLVAMVSRLTDQKGFQLVTEKMGQMMEMGLQIIVLGTGEAAYEAAFLSLQEAYPGRVAARITFDTSLAQRIYAGSDLFLMPSAFEPCGLSQLMALRYGTLPLVHETGGLRDTVQPYNQYTGQGTGFSFYHFDGDTMMDCLGLAYKTYHDRDAWYYLRQHAMEADFSWSDPARAYLDLYQSLS